VSEDETEGFFTTPRIDAFVAWKLQRENPKPKSLTLGVPEFPTGVTLENWPELQAAGWRYLTNLRWPFVPLKGFGDPAAIYEGIKARHGEANVLVGLPWELYLQRPVNLGGVMVGVYVLENLELPEAVRKFIAEHEEQPR
jgi:hypothetical protein